MYSNSRISESNICNIKNECPNKARSEADSARASQANPVCTPPPRDHAISSPAAHYMDLAANNSWFAPEHRPLTHNQAVRTVSGEPVEHVRYDLRSQRAIFAKPVPVMAQPDSGGWPMDVNEKPASPPPWPSEAERRAMQKESACIPAEEPLGPLAAGWVKALHDWYAGLQKTFEFDPTDLPANLKKHAAKWEQRLQYLKLAERDLFDSVMSNIRTGHKIPFGDTKPEAFFRRRNPPSLEADKTRAWAAIEKDMAHGALVPVNIATEGLPVCVCPVRTADKNDGTARFVHNSRRVNKCVPKEASACELESLLKTRNMFIKGGFIVGLDFASGYHCLSMQEEDQKYLAFALHVNELPPHAVEWLKAEFPNAFMPDKQCFVFKYVALPFGLSSSCRTFNDLIAALVGFWRRCPTGGEGTRASNYIDDVMGVTRSFDAAMMMSIRMVFEAASLGLSLKISKCSFFPRHSMKALGTIVNLRSFRFSVSKLRVVKIAKSMLALKAAVARNERAVPAKLVASFIGLIWSIAACCHRAASVMVRAITDVLTQGMKLKMGASGLSLSMLLSRFWSGSVSWSKAAQAQLEFWLSVQFGSLSAPISADVLGLAIEQTFWYPEGFNQDQVSFLFQDASATATGGGTMSMHEGQLRPNDDLFLAEFDAYLAASSSTLRELTGILWCLQANVDRTKSKLVFICDNWSSCRAILRGSKVPNIQRVAEAIFHWSLKHGKVCWPIWVPRTHRLIVEADRRSRMRIPHDERSPRGVVACANEMAVRLWGRCISFDQAASHRSAIVVQGQVLPFNAFCYQPGAAGVDMFRCVNSWHGNVNYVFPPEPLVGRLLTFLPYTNARSVVVIKKTTRRAWWSYSVQPNAHGLVASRDVLGFTIFAFDFVEAPQALTANQFRVCVV